MDAYLDTLSTKLYQVNTRVSRIARRQARFGGFMESPSPPPKAPKASKDDDDSNDDDDGEDDVYLTLLPFVTRDKKWE